MSATLPLTIGSDKFSRQSPESTNATGKEVGIIASEPHPQQVKLYDTPPKCLDDRLKAYHISEDEAIVKIVSYYKVHLGEKKIKVDPELDYDAEEAVLDLEINCKDFFTDINRYGEEILAQTTVETIIDSTENMLAELGFSSDWAVDEEGIEDITSENIYRSKCMSELLSNIRNVMLFKSSTRKRKFSVPVYKLEGYTGPMDNPTDDEDLKNTDPDDEKTHSLLYRCNRRLGKRKTVYHGKQGIKKPKIN